jgi:hypothetical protein
LEKSSTVKIGYIDKEGYPRIGGTANNPFDQGWRVNPKNYTKGEKCLKQKSC